MSRHRTLYVLRHAKSSWDEPGSDHDRGLAARGVRDLTRVSDVLVERGVTPDLVLCSTARRALDTLGALLPVLGDPDVSNEDDLYGATHRQLAERLRRIDESVGSVMVVGHNPGLQELVLELATDGPARQSVWDKFPTAALATLELDGPWCDLSPESARLTAYVRPRDLPKV